MGCLSGSLPPLPQPPAAWLTPLVQSAAVRAFYHDQFVLPLPPGHRFPMVKYERLRSRLLAESVLDTSSLHVSPAADDEDLLRVHTPSYLDRLMAGSLSVAEQRRIGFPWSRRMVERSRRSVGGTLAASRAALDHGLGINLAGGTHHAYPDRGAGFCVFNDVAVAVRSLQADGRIRRALIVDCDVHQGDGTAAIFAGDPNVFTFSIHGARNYPHRKVPGDLDIGLADLSGDEEYLAPLSEGLWRSLAQANPEMIVYLAGADPFFDDRLGRLALSKGGLAQRDQMVLDACLGAGLPLAIVMAGGYARQIEDTVDIHLTTIRLAVEMIGASG